jgi:phosphoglycolate phosphatase
VSDAGGAAAAADDAPALRCFDLDGCVVVSDEAIADGLRHALDAVGLPQPDAAGVRAAIGPPLLSTIAGLLRAAGTDPDVGEGAELLATAVATYRARYVEVGFDLTRPVPGIVPLLEELAAAGAGVTVIVTAKPAAVAEPLLEHLGLRHAFAAVHGAPMGPEVEEKRVTLARALAATGTAPRDAIMIGDRSHDVLAGRACGTRTVGVLWGAGDRDELERAGADLVVERPGELGAVLLRRGASAGR